MASKKISEFTQQLSFEQTDLVNIVRNGTNFTVPFSAYAPALGVTGTINIVGTSGTPILEQPSGTINNIRTFEDGSGILSAISATNGIKVSHNFTFNKTGATLVVDETIASPVFRSIVAGAGVSVSASGEQITIGASATSSSNTVIVNQESDFPAASGGVINLVDNTHYVIGADVSTSNRFMMGENNVITGNSVLSPTLTYTGSGDMFTGVDVSAVFDNVRLSAPSCTEYFDFSSPTTVGGDIVNFRAVLLITGGGVGTFNDLQSLSMIDVAGFLVGTGITAAGTTNWSILSLDKTGFSSSSASYIGCDLGSSVHQTLEFNDCIFRAPAGAEGIKGLASSGNVTANNLATVINTEFSGGLDPLTNITTSDIRWDFRGNAGVKDTITDALLGFNNNATETVISITSTPVIVNATWVCERESKFTCTTGGRATYDGERDGTFPADVAVGLVASGGGSKDATVYIAVNGSVITNSGRTVQTSGSTPRTLSIPWQLDLSDGDYVEVYISNDTDTVNLIVEHAVLRIN